MKLPAGKPLLKLPPGKPLVKFPEMVREKFAENVLEKLAEKLREKAVELKARVKLNCPSGIALRLLLLCTTNTADPAMQAGSAKPGRVWFEPEVVLVVVVELELPGPKKEHPPLPGVTRSELMETGWDPVFWMVTRRLPFESAALLITTLSCVVDVASVETVVGMLVEVWLVLELWLDGMRNM